MHAQNLNFCSQSCQMVSQQDDKRSSFLQTQDREVEQSEVSDLIMIKARHEQEMKELDNQLANQLKLTDQEIILELDQIVSEQQSTLQQAAVPFFKITNNPQDIQIQTYILGFIQRLNKDVIA